MRLPAANTPYARPTIFVDWAFSATNAVVLFGVPTLLPLTENTMWNILHVAYVRLSSGPRIAITSMMATSIVTTTILLSLPSGVMVATPLSSSNLWKYIAMVKINTGTLNAT